jgi:hypothetical protein
LTVSLLVGTSTTEAQRNTVYFYKGQEAESVNHDPSLLSALSWTTLVVWNDWLSQQRLARPFQRRQSSIGESLGRVWIFNKSTA